ncbi:MAG TPA: hypothetical protein VE131_15765, partial [Terriglobales bacterium]|nr:hypothetical protein [Terriglobales bacterium]
MLLLVIGLGLPLFSAKVALTQDAVEVNNDGANVITAQAAADKPPADLAMASSDSATPGADFEYDPWEPFNEKMFWFNREVLDRFVLKPA